MNRREFFKIGLIPLAIAGGITSQVFASSATTPDSEWMFHRMLVVRLMDQMRNMMFMFNDENTRVHFTDETTSLLYNNYYSKREISDFHVVCNMSNNSPSQIDMGELHAHIGYVRKGFVYRVELDLDPNSVSYKFLEPVGFRA